MRDTGFGQTKPYLDSNGIILPSCSPWAAGEVGLVNTNTGGVMNVEFVRHWSWHPSNKRVYFTIYEGSMTEAEAKIMMNNFFDNTGSAEELLIDVITVEKL